MPLDALPIALPVLLKTARPYVDPDSRSRRSDRSRRCIDLHLSGASLLGGLIDKREEMRNDRERPDAVITQSKVEKLLECVLFGVGK